MPQHARSVDARESPVIRLPRRKRLGLGKVAREGPGGKTRAKPTLAGVEQQRESRRPCAYGASHVGGANVARPRVAHVDALRAGDKHAKRDAADEIRNCARDKRR